MYALFHILLSGYHGLLAYLDPHLRGLIVHEAPERGRELAPSGLRLAGSAHLSAHVLAAVGRAVVAPGLGLGRWGGAHHGDCRDMLGDGVVEGRGVSGWGVVGAALHGLLGGGCFWQVGAWASGEGSLERWGCCWLNGISKVWSKHTVAFLEGGGPGGKVSRPHRSIGLVVHISQLENLHSSLYIEHPLRCWMDLKY